MAPERDPSGVGADPLTAGEQPQRHDGLPGAPLVDHEPGQQHYPGHQRGDGERVPPGDDGIEALLGQSPARLRLNVRWQPGHKRRRCPPRLHPSEPARERGKPVNNQPPPARAYAVISGHRKI